jgi:uncharacterized ion transporter superfamily protein YfcC
MKKMTKVKKFPDSLVIIFAFMILFALLTWIVPSGEFDREMVNHKSVVIPGTYHSVESNPISFNFFLMPIKGFISASEIIAFILFVGGIFSLLNKTNAINAFLFRIIEFSKKSKSAKSMVIPLIMFFFSLGGATFGMAEETLVFIMITIPLCISMGYDAVVGVSVAFIGAAVGFAGAFFNPFTIGIAQGISGIEIFSGWEYRLIIWLIFTFVGIIYISKYASKIEKDKSKSLVGKIDYEGKFSAASLHTVELTTKRIIILFLVAFAILLLVLGVQSNPIIEGLDWLSGWYIEELCALFFALGLISGLIYGFNFDQMVKYFGEGVKDMAMPAVIVAFAKSIVLIGEEGKIIDTILYYVSNVGQDLPNYISVQIMFLVQTGINFFVPSGSGQAALTMPLMAPLSDMLGISRQTAVLAYQFGDGITNMIIPTSAILMGVLQIAKIPYDKWFKFILPLVVILSIISIILLIIPVMFISW